MSKVAIKHPTLTARRKDIARDALEVVRLSKTMGKGSCSCIDECYSDAELLVVFHEALLKDNARSITALVKMARQIHRLFEEQCKEVQNA